MPRQLLLLAILSLCVLLPGASGDKSLEQTLLKAHGLDAFDRIEEIRFTFVVERATGNTERRWEWRPATGDVTLTDAAASPPTMISYNRNAMDGAPEAVATADRRFINDSFWLMWPLHASWADDAQLSRNEDGAVVLAYPPDGGGYTPGDKYVVTVDDAGLATGWAFHRRGAEEPSLVCSFESYVTAGPLTLATDHKNDSGFRLRFTDICVKMKGEAEWRVAGE